MPLFPKLTPLQSRCAASLAASILLLLVYLSLTKPHFAYAADVDVGRQMLADGHPAGLIDPFDTQREHDERGIVTPRAADGVSALANNSPQNKNIAPGDTQYWMFPKAAINGPPGEQGSGLPSSTLDPSPPSAGEGDNRRKRQDSTSITVYITLNTCLQPSANVTTAPADGVPPQLLMYVSSSPANQKPGPAAPSADQVTVTVDGGYALYEVDADADADTDLYVGVSAPNTTQLSGIWNYEVAASIDAPYHGSRDDISNLFFVDGDNHAALLITNDTTQAFPNETDYQKWMNLHPPWGVLAANQEQTAILGVQHSFCGLRNAAPLAVNIAGFDNQNVAKMTNRGLGGKPKEQFYITGLNATAKYWGFLAMNGNSTASGGGVVGGGGTVWAAIQFQTKTEANCALMYNLSFCSEVAYAVPTNPDKFPPETGLPDLAALYDSHAAQMYQYFNYSLQQIPCNTTSSAQYSLARNCDDCARAYKQWLCAVTIPRCADFSATDPWLMPRNLGQAFVNGSTISTAGAHVDQQLLRQVATNSSRNPIIDTSIRPGPYKEVLPCQDLCWDLMQSCPASLGFACPLAGAGLADSYGTRSNDSGVISCSYLGAAYYLSGARHLLPPCWAMLATMILVILRSWAL